MCDACYALEMTSSLVFTNLRKGMLAIYVGLYEDAMFATGFPLILVLTMASHVQIMKRL